MLCAEEWRHDGILHVTHYSIIGLHVQLFTIYTDEVSAWKVEVGVNSNTIQCVSINPSL